MSAKEDILQRIRTAQTEDDEPGQAVPRAYRTANASRPDEVSPEAVSPESVSPEASRGGLLDLLVDRLREYGASVHRATPETAAALIGSAVRTRGAANLVVPEGFPPELHSELAETQLLPDDPPLSPAQLDAVDGVLTLCRIAIAETGTIILDTGPGQGRRAVTLVPDFHLCVVTAGQVVAGVPEAIAELAAEQTGHGQAGNELAGNERGARPLTWISGPSATSDIELQRVEGVHGPRTLVVILVEDLP
jgi:L-lactate dehydrogenase complex protein LldG